jgi:predicted HNH restriction endonuclease
MADEKLRKRWQKYNTKRKIYHHQYGSKWSKDNRIRLNEKLLLRRQQKRAWAIASKGSKCQQCGFDNPDALEFHHATDTKEFTIANMVRYNQIRLKQELDKCVLLCANCHSIEHARERRRCNS